MVVIIATCSNRKRTPPDPRLRAREIDVGTLEEVADDWQFRLKSANALAPASETYCGRAFSEAYGAANALGAPLYVISAGLGLVRSDDRIPSYNLTIAARSADNILARITFPTSPADWWRHGASLSHFNRGIGVVLEQACENEELVLLALPGSYLGLVQQELSELPESLLRRLRIFTATSSHEIDDRMRSLVMPYDGRLDGEDSPARGTMSDFSSRALADFIKWVLPEFAHADAETHRGAVSKRLTSWAGRRQFARKRQADAEILDLLRQNWASSGSSASRALRIFRDEFGIACEQARFRLLFSRVQAEMDGQT